MTGTAEKKPVIKPTPNGPYVVKDLPALANQKGPIEMAKSTIALCRCGKSANKPFCDGAHSASGFSSDKQEDRREDAVDRYEGGGSSPLGESSANAGAAIVAIFSQGGDASPAKRLVVDSRTCSSIGEGPPGVTSSDRGKPGIYGVAGQQVTVTASDFCTNSSTGLANSGDVLFASYEITGSLTASCSDGSNVSINWGSGIWRETDTHSPEIYGSFVAAGERFNCTIFLQKNDEGIVDSSQCSDSSGALVDVLSPITCTIN